MRDPRSLAFGRALQHLACGMGWSLRLERQRLRLATVSIGDRDNAVGPHVHSCLAGLDEFHEAAGGRKIIPLRMIYASQMVGRRFPLKVLNQSPAVRALVECPRNEAAELFEAEKAIPGVCLEFGHEFRFSVHRYDYGADIGWLAD